MLLSIWNILLIFKTFHIQISQISPIIFHSLLPMASLSMISYPLPPISSLSMISYPLPLSTFLIVFTHTSPTLRFPFALSACHLSLPLNFNLFHSLLCTFNPWPSLDFDYLPSLPPPFHKSHPNLYFNISTPSRSNRWPNDAVVSDTMTLVPMAPPSLGCTPKKWIKICLVRNVAFQTLAIVFFLIITH